VRLRLLDVVLDPAPDVVPLLLPGRKAEKLADRLDATAQTLRTADGRSLCFADWGNADGYPVFSLHGSPGCRLSVRGVELVTALGGRLVTYDRPGNGQSDRQRGRAAVDCVSDVEAVADALGLEEFAVGGGSSGSPHALAVGARLAGRVSRVACFGAIAPLMELGWDEWSKDQDDETRTELTICRESEQGAAARFAKMDAEMRASVSPDDPEGAMILEQTRNGVWGWVDDEIVNVTAWGFDPAEVSAPTAIWSHPDDTVTPPNHAEWLATAIPSAFLVSSPNALGHVAIDDPVAARTELYAWLISGTHPGR
jgi:pimeloyl-ACP methyl ester carboxylesterase